jgi:O-antigen ligase
MIIFSVALCYCLKKEIGLKKIIFYSFLFAYLILFFDAFFQLITGSNIIGYKAHEERISSFFGTKLIMGSFVARTLPVVLAISFLVNFSYKIFFQIFILIISGTLVFLSGERTSLAYYLITLTSYIVLTFNKKNIFKIIFLFTVMFSLLIFIKPSSVKRFVSSTLMQFKEVDNQFINLSYRHQLHFITAFNIFSDKKILGHGVNSFRHLCFKDEYAPIKKIIDDHKFFSPSDGYFFIKTDENGYTVVGIKPSNSADVNLNEIFSEKLGINSFRVIGELKLIYKNNGDFVRKGDAIYSAYEHSNGCNTHPHNIHLQFLSEVGLVGYVFLLFAYLFIVIRMSAIIFKYFREKKLINYNYSLFFILLSFFISFFPFFPSGNFFNNWLSSICYFNIGILMYIIFFVKKNS